MNIFIKTTRATQAICLGLTLFAFHPIQAALEFTVIDAGTCETAGRPWDKWEGISNEDHCREAAAFNRLSFLTAVSSGTTPGCHYTPFQGGSVVYVAEGPSTAECAPHFPCLCMRDVDRDPDRAVCKPETTSTLPEALTVFATESNHLPGTFGGVAGADAICQQEAAAAGLAAGGRTFVAWLSDSTRDARDRVVPFADGPYVLPDGVTVVADGFEQFVDGSALNHLIDQTARGETIGAYPPDAWTGTLTDGRVAQETCQDWTNGTDGNGRYGSTTDARQERFWVSRAATRCTKSFRFYCVEKEGTIRTSTSSHLTFQPDPNKYYTIVSRTGRYMSGFDILNYANRKSPIIRLTDGFRDQTEHHWRFIAQGDKWILRNRGTGLDVKLREQYITSQTQLEGNGGVTLRTRAYPTLEGHEPDAPAIKWNVACNNGQFVHVTSGDLAFMDFSNSGFVDLKANVRLSGLVPADETIPHQFILAEVNAFKRVAQIDPSLSIDMTDNLNMFNRADESVALLAFQGIFKIGVALIPMFGGALLQSVMLLDSFGFGFSALSPDEPNLVAFAEAISDALFDLEVRTMANTQLLIDQALATDAILDARSEMNNILKYFVLEYRPRKLDYMETQDLVELNLLSLTLNQKAGEYDKEIGKLFGRSFDMSQTTAFRLMQSFDLLKQSLLEYFTLQQENVFLEAYTDGSCENAMEFNRVREKAEDYSQMVTDVVATIERFRVDQECCGDDSKIFDEGRGIQILDAFIREPDDYDYDKRDDTDAVRAYKAEMRFDIEHLSFNVTLIQEYLAGIADVTLAMCEELVNDPTARFQFETETLPRELFPDTNI